MAVFTLAEAQKLGLDDLQAGIAETIWTTAPVLSALPFMQISGNALTFNREKTLVDGQYVAADGTITDSSALTNDKVTVSLQPYSGQSDIPNSQLRQQIGVNGGNDLRGIHLMSAAKGVSRKFLTDMVSGTVANNGFDGLRTLLASTPFSAQVEDAANGDFSLDLVDAAIIRLKGRPDFIMGNGKAEAAFKKALRAAGGVTTVELNGQFFTAYDGIPFLRNDYIAADYVSGTAGNQTDIYFGSWGDGTPSSGVQALTSSGDLFTIEEFPTMEDKSATRVRVILDAAVTIWTPGMVSVLKAVKV